VAPLERAVALVEVDHLARAVGEDLHLDVARVDHRLLEVEGRVAEGRLGLTLGRLERVAQGLLGLDPPHTASAAARDRLDEDGEADLGGRGLEGVEVGAGLGAAQRRQARGAGGGDGAGLVAGEVQHRGRRPDEGDAGGVARLGEQGVLREEAVARVDRVGAGGDGLGDDRLVVEVGPHGVARLADLVGLVGLEPVLALSVLVGEDRDGARPQLGRGPEGSDGDLASVGDEHLAEHRTSRGGGGLHAPTTAVSRVWSSATTKGSLTGRSGALR
jgi:hypothetical protein